MDTCVNNNGKFLVETCKSFDLRIVNGRFGEDKGIGSFTCHKVNGKSVVDYAIVSSKLLTHISHFCIDDHDSCMSDVHSPVCLTLCSHESVNPRQDSNIQRRDSGSIGQSLPDRYFWKSDQQSEYTNAFSLDDIDILASKITGMGENCSQANMDEIAKNLCSIFLDSAQKVGLCKKSASNANKRNNKVERKYPHQPWFNDMCHSKRKEYMLCKNKVRTAVSLEDKQRYLDSFRTKAKEYKKLIKSCKKSHERSFSDSLRNVKSANPREYWNLLNKDKSKVKPSNKISLDSFMEHFKNLSQIDRVDEENNDSTFDPLSVNHSVNEDINREFTFDEVLSVTKKLKNGKASGIDNILNEYLKNCPNSAMSLIVHIFNLVLKTGIVPTDWSIGIIQPLYKNKGTIDDPDNYRGITLLSCIGKLFTACINVRLTLFLEGSGTIGEEQAGFREGYSTTDHIFVLNTLIELHLAHKARIFCAFVDYRKAFDLVDRSALWRKLIGSHVNGNILRVIHNMYLNAKSCVRSGNFLSDTFSCNIGVRQGGNLSPLLFALFLNDFELYLSKHYSGLQHICEDMNRILSDDDVEFFIKIFVLLYADDTIVLAESAEELQSALNAVHDYCNDWSLHVNTTKTKIVVFSSGKVRNLPTFWFGNNTIDVVDDYVYLGTMFNYNGSHVKAISKQVAQARRAMFSLLTKARRLSIPIDLQCDLFEKLVLPILLYGCEVWGYSNIKQIEVFYRNFLRSLLKVGKYTPSCMVYGELGKAKIVSFVNKRMFCFWARLVEGKASKLSSILYQLLYKMFINNGYKSKWISKVKSILDDLGLSYIWHYQESQNNVSSCKRLVFAKIDDVNVQIWNGEVSDHKHCRMYKTIKMNNCVEMYLLNLKFDERVSLTKFRCGNHWLPVNDDRFSPHPLPKACLLCDRPNASGDEFHYLFECSAFSANRKLYLKNYYYNSPNSYKMNELFNTKNVKELSDLAKFVSLIMSRFRYH